MKSFLKFTRYAEWWEYKLVPLMSVGYTAIILNDYSFHSSLLQLLLLLLSVITGAIYVSVINDLTDIREDAAAGKKNRMAGMYLWQKILIVGFCLALGVYWGYLIFPDKLSLFFYIMAWVIFSLYSIPPARLKKRGIWGALADASGAHMFPSLLIISSLFWISGTKLNPVLGIAVGLWALFYGLRGILWHQFYDRENDIVTQTRTFATRVQPANFKWPERVIFIIEIAAFIIVATFLFNIWILLALIMYILLAIARIVILKYQTNLIVSPKEAPYQLLMNDFYLVFFPIALLFTITFAQPYGWLLLCFHLLLFPTKIIQVLKDYVLIAKLALKKIL